MQDGLWTQLLTIYNQPYPQADERRAAYISAIKEFLAQQEELIKIAHYAGGTGREILTLRTELIDSVIQCLYRLLAEETGSKGYHPDFLSVLSAGGYGRRELHPYSDIDIIFLHRGKANKTIEDFTTRFLHYLWDIGFDLGHSVRSVEDCLEFARIDLASQTSIMESRLLAGDKDTFSELESQLTETVVRLRTDSYIKGKIQELKERHQHYGNSLYHLEPNIKNGVGGLRDLQTSLWVAQARFGVRNFDGLQAIGVISENEKKVTLENLDFLWRVRNDLHYAAKRKQDIMSFLYQPTVAKDLGFHDDTIGDSIENLMKQYYRTARHIAEYSQVYTNRCFPPSARGAHSHGIPATIIPGIFQQDGCIHLQEFSPVKITAPLIMRCFLESQRRNIPISIATKTLIRNRWEEIPESDFLRTESLEIINQMLLETGNLYLALRQMHELQILERFIPEFQGLTCLVRHDLQHRYTVDEHTLRLVMYLQQLKNQTTLEKDDKEKPPRELVKVYHEVNEDKVLMLSALLHDIGKVAKKHHVDSGLIMLPIILERLQLSEIERNKITSLVAIHHLMSEVAQHHDLDDKRVLMDFVEKVGSVERLKLLYCITYADMRSVSAEVWTPWKAVLLSELYHKAQAIIEGKPFLDEEESRQLQEIRQAITKVYGDRITPEELEQHFTGMPSRYILGTDPTTIGRHIEIIRDLLSLPLTVHWKDSGANQHIAAKDYPLMTLIQHKPNLKYSELTVFTLDMPGLFSQIAGTLASKSMSIMGAQIFTRSDGIVIDTFQLDHQSPGWTEDEIIWDELTDDLRKVLTGEMDISAIIRSRQKQQKSKIRSVPGTVTKVSVSADISDTQTVIDVRTSDRIGLLYTLTHTLSQLGLSISTARIATYGPRAVDVFYVTDIDGRKITDPLKLQEMQASLEKALAS